MDQATLEGLERLRKLATPGPLRFTEGGTAVNPNCMQLFHCGRSSDERVRDIRHATLAYVVALFNAAPELLDPHPLGAVDWEALATHVAVILGYTGPMLTLKRDELIEVLKVHALPSEQQTPQNFGHGHVWPRADGKRMRCGGPVVCAVCAKELADKRRQEQHCTHTFASNPGMHDTQHRYCTKCGRAEGC